MEFPETAGTSEDSVRFMKRNFYVKDQEPLTDRMAVRLFRLEVSHQDPKAALRILQKALENLGLQGSVAAPPSLASEPNWPNKKGFAFLFGLVSIPATFVLLIFWRYLRRTA